MFDKAVFLKAVTAPRYWEDAFVNGLADADGNIPLRDGDDWSLVIELTTGRILDWPEGVEASVHYKVCVLLPIIRPGFKA